MSASSTPNLSRRGSRDSSRESMRGVKKKIVEILSPKKDKEKSHSDEPPGKRPISPDITVVDPPQSKTPPQLSPRTRSPTPPPRSPTPPPISPLQKTRRTLSPPPPRKPGNIPNPPYPSFQYPYNVDPKALSKNMREQLDQEYDRRLKEREGQQKSLKEQHKENTMQFLVDSMMRIEGRLQSLEDNQVTLSQTQDRNREIIVTKQERNIKPQINKKEDSIQLLVEQMERSEEAVQLLAHQMDLLARNQRKINTFENPSILKKKIKKLKPKESSSESDSEPTYCPGRRKPVINSNNWQDYLDPNYPLVLPNADWESSWEAEGKIWLKTKYSDMGRLQSKEAQSLKLLQAACKEYNDRLRTITNSPGEIYSLNNIARLARNWMIRFRVCPSLFNQLYTEFCLPAQLRALVITSGVVSDGEESLLAWLSSRNLNQGSETRLKREIRGYIQRTLQQKDANIAQLLSNVQGILLPELLSSSNTKGWTSTHPKSRSSQAERETRNFFLDSIETHHPLLYNYLGLSGEITGDLSTIGQRVESFINFTKNTPKNPKMIAEMKKGTEKNEDIMKTILELEDGQKSTKNTRFDQLRLKCFLHKGDQAKCKAEKSHCFRHSTTVPVPFPCASCPAWLQLKYKAK